MKKLSTNIITENSETKKITVFVEDETAAALAHCDEEIRHLYILDEHEAQNLTRKETRRHISYESITEKAWILYPRKKVRRTGLYAWRKKNAYITLWQVLRTSSIKSFGS